MLLNPYRFGGGGGGGSDPFFANVVALLHFDGANGSTAFTDVKGHTFTATSGASISTSQSKFGGSSLALNGTSDLISSANNSDWDFGSGDFTIECFIRPTALSYRQIVFRVNGDYALQIHTAGNLRGLFNGSTPVGGGATTISTGSWSHVALVRDGTTMRIFLNGIQEATAGVTGALNNSNGALQVGADPINSRYFAGHIDELRITKGVARYTSGFTPPSAAFPDS